MKKSKVLACVTALLMTCQLAACSDNPETESTDETADAVSSAEEETAETASAASSPTDDNSVLQIAEEKETTAETAVPLPVYADTEKLNDAYNVTFTSDYGYSGIREKKDCDYWDSYIMSSSSTITYTFYSEYDGRYYRFRTEYEDDDYYLDSGVQFYTATTAHTYLDRDCSSSLIRAYSSDAEIFFYDTLEDLNASEKWFGDYSDYLYECHSIAAEDNSSLGLGDSNFYKTELEPVGGCGNEFSFKYTTGDIFYLNINTDTYAQLYVDDILGSSYGDVIYNMILGDASKNANIWLSDLKNCVYSADFAWYLNSDQQLVVVFGTGMVAPFSEGTVEFAIDLSDVYSDLTSYGKSLVGTSTYLSSVSIDTNKPISAYTDYGNYDWIKNTDVSVTTAIYDEEQANKLIEMLSGYNVTIKDKSDQYQYDDIIYCEATPFIAPNSPNSKHTLTINMNNQNDTDVKINGLSLYLVDDIDDPMPVIFKNGSCIYELNEDMAAHSSYSFELNEDALDYSSLSSGKYKLVISANNEYVIRNLYINTNLAEEEDTWGYFTRYYSRGCLDFLTDEQYEAFNDEAVYRETNTGDRGSRIDFSGVDFKVLKSDDNEVIFKSVSILCFGDFPESVYYEDNSFHMTKTASGWVVDVFDEWI
jgi:hypothetical protein